MRVLILLFLSIISVHSFGQKPKLILPIGHTGDINSVEFSPDGKYILTASDDRNAILWETKTGKVVRLFEGDSYYARFNDDGTKIITSSQSDTSSVIWSITGEKQATFSENLPIVYADFWDKNETILIVSGKNISVFNSIDYKPKYKLNHGEKITTFKSSNNKELMITVSDSTVKNDGYQSYRQMVKIWDIINGVEIKTIRFHCRYFNDIEFNADGTQILIRADSTVTLYETRSGNILHVFESDDEYMWQAEFSPNGSKLITSSKYSSVIWDTHKFIKISSLKVREPDFIKFDPTENFIFTQEGYGSCKIWNANTGDLIMGITQDLNTINSMVFSPDGNVFVTISALDGRAIIWNSNTAGLLRVLNTRSSYISTAKFSRDGKYFVTTSTNFFNNEHQGGPAIWDISTGQLIKKIEGVSESDAYSSSLRAADDACFFPDGKNILVYCYDNIKEWNISENNESNRLLFLDHWAASVELSRDSNLVLANFGERAVVYDKTGSVILRETPLGQFTSDRISKVHFSNDAAKIIAFYGFNDTVKIFNLNDKEVVTFKANYYEYGDAQLSTDNKFVVNTMQQTPTKIYDSKTGNLLATIPNKGISKFYSNEDKLISSFGDTLRIVDIKSQKEQARILIKGEFYDVNFTSNRLLSYENDQLFVYDIISGKELAHLIILDKSEYIWIAPTGHYFSTPSASKSLSWRIENKLYGFDQFDLKYNRPDIVLEKLGCTDSSLINAYYEAYLRRLKKSGFTEDMLKDDLHLPEIKIENYESIPPISIDDTLKLNLKLEDIKYPLDRINIWINDVAIFGTNGISLRTKNIMSHTTSLDVPLALGKNKIQVSILNQAGAESYKETIEIESTAGKTTTDLYIVSLGISNYKDSRYNLTYASKDANDMSATFQENEFFSNVFTKTVTDEKVVLENLIALKTFLSPADINDQVIIFVAGHGVLDANFDYYFASYDMDFQNPSARGIPYEMIEALLDGIKPLKKLLFMDTCHSGEVDKDEIQVSENSTESEGDIVFRNVGVEVENKENQLGLQNTSELMKSLFTDLRKGTGATVISSAGGVEFAMESDTWQNGLFTYCLIDGLINKKADLNNDKMIMVSELQTYIQAEVNKLSNGKQTPTSRIENNELDYRVW